MNSYHARNGFYFQRLPSGRVEVTVKGGYAEYSTILDAVVWAKVIAAVSAAGENSQEVFEAALRLHQGDSKKLPYRQAMSHWEELEP